MLLQFLHLCYKVVLLIQDHSTGSFFNLFKQDSFYVDGTGVLPRSALALLAPNLQRHTDNSFSFNTFSGWAVACLVSGFQYNLVATELSHLSILFQVS